MPPCIILRDGDAAHEYWLAFNTPHTVLAAYAVADVLPVVIHAQEASARGQWVAGYLAYEAACAFDPALAVHASIDGLPLAWFGVFDEPVCLDALPETDEMLSSCAVLPEWTPTESDAAYAQKIARVRDYIAAGDTYQVNLTRRLRAAFSCDAYAFFVDRYRVQPTPHAAFLQLPDHAIVSLSPELFFRLDHDMLTCCPMKGTRARGLWAADDLAQRDALSASSKDCAENAMIVDMMRNDCGRIAQPGSVRVASAFDVEPFRTVWQMTSMVTAQTDADIVAILRALFPCASITGAPKVRTMQIIRELESDPRGVYCGAIGYLAPERRAVFSVAIRTATVDRRAQRAEYGVGGGIVWDSDADAEVHETWVKTAALTRREAPFSLLETLLWRPHTGYRLLAGHLERLAASAAYFGFPYDETCVLAALVDAVARFGEASARVRLLVDRHGTPTVEHVPLTLDRPRPIRRIALAQKPVDSTSRFLYHKTTERTVYEAARAGMPAGIDDVLLVNERGEVTETLIANAFFHIDGAWVTPPRASGVLGGVFREALVRRGRVQERVVRIEDALRADRILLANSVRGFMPAVIP